ncbi:helix-turn-helix domain-containing protein, partial [Bacillus paramycoides]
MKLGSQLKKFRESKSFSQEDVVRKVGVTRNVYFTDVFGLNTE